MKTRMLFTLLLFILPYLISAEEYKITSPDQKIEVSLKISERISFSVAFMDEVIVEPSNISLNIKDIGELGKNSIVESIERNVITIEHTPVVNEKSAVINEHCNEIKIHFLEHFFLVFRVYNDGVAYRYITEFEDDIVVSYEEFACHFPFKSTAWFPEEESFFSHNEREYKYSRIDTLNERFCSLPVLVEPNRNIKVLITESSLIDYPGMWMKGGDNTSLQSIFPGYPLQTQQTSDRDVKVTRYADYIAKTDGYREFPWRILVIADEDADLVSCQLPWLLAPENRIRNTFWIKPGKVAWDWWNANNVWDVDFEAGINTETYKYYIDFASEYGIEYIILDEGWYELGDLMTQTENIDVQEIIQYGREKGVGVILWVVWKTLDDQLVEALDLFESWGVAGLKVDFMQRDDQEMVNYYWKIAEEAAMRKMLVDFHGAYKPSGLRRAYPNVLTREGVRGLEWNKWSNVITPEHDLILPFTRMVAGPMDYTPGAMRNAQKDNFFDFFSRPMSQGTRCHQMAMYVVYESPLQMLADSPSNYLKEKNCTEFISSVPVVWDETIVLEAKVGDYLVIARRSGDEWFIGGMTDWSDREFEIDLSFLPGEEYQVDIFKDGRNAHRNAEDFKHDQKTVKNTDKLKIKMAPGGGWVAHLY